MRKSICFFLAGMGILLMSVQLSCQACNPHTPAAAQPDTVVLSQLYFDKVKFKYLTKELEGTIKTENLASDGLLVDAGLTEVKRRYSKSYMNPEESSQEAAVTIYETASKEDLDAKEEDCVKAVKSTNCLSAITLDRFLIVFYALDFDTKSANRKIFEKFYVPKGGKIIFQAQSAIDEE